MRSNFTQSAKIVVCSLSLLLILLLSILPGFGQAVINYNKTAVIKRLTDFGAIPNDNIDDSQAWKTACDWFSTSSNINYTTQYGKLIIPTGTFIVGKQKINTTPSNTVPYAESQYPAIINNVDGLIIEGEPGAKLKLPDHIKFGYFDSNGNPVNSASTATAANSGHLLRLGHVSGSYVKNIIIQNLEIDGNSDKYIVGGYSDPVTGYQIQNFGIYSEWAEFVTLKNLYIHKFGTDGIYLALPTTTTLDATGNARWNALLENVKSDSSGRNCLTWSGGSLLKIIDSKFRWAGGSQASSGPWACIDIETDDEAIHHGLIENSTLQSSYRNSPLNIAGSRPTSGILFKNTIINSDKSGTAITTIHSQSRDFRFEDCTISGVIYTDYSNSSLTNTIKFPNSGKTVFKRSIINQGAMQSNILSICMLSDLCEFDSCIFNSTDRAFIAVGGLPNGQAVPNSDYSVIKNCTFYTNKAINSDAIGWGYANQLRFEGKNRFFLTANSVPQQHFSRRNIYNSIIVGSNNPNNRDEFVTDKYFYTQQYEGSFLKIGENECSYVDFIITDKSIYDNGAGKEILINRNASIIVKSGGTLLLSGIVKLYGKIIVEPGGYLYINHNATIYTCSGINSGNIVMNGNHGVGPGIWNPETPKSPNPLAISGSLSGCVTCATESNTYNCGGYSFTNGQLLGTAWGRNVYVKIIGACMYLTIDNPNDGPLAKDWLYILVDENTFAPGVTPFPRSVVDNCFKAVGEPCSGRVAASPVNTESASQSLSVYPNPTSSQFQVSFFIPIGEKATLSMTDLKGNMWLDKSITGRGVHHEHLQLPDAPAGTYLINLKQATGIQTKKIVIVR